MAHIKGKGVMRVLTKVIVFVVLILLASNCFAQQRPYGRDGRWSRADRAWNRIEVATSFSPLDIPNCVFYAPLGESNEVLGSDLVTNGDFSANISGWNNGITGSFLFETFEWQAGKLHADAATAATKIASSDDNINVVAGVRYRTTFDVVINSGSDVGFSLRNAIGSGVRIDLGTRGTGSHVVDGTVPYTEDLVFQFNVGAKSDFTVDNVVVKKLTTADLVSSNNGTFPNGISYGTDRLGRANRAMVFDGVNQSTSFTLTGVNIKSFSAWVYLDDNTTRDIIDFNGAASVAVDGSGNVALTGITGGTVYVNGVAGVAVPASTWTNVIVTATTTIAGGACEFGYAGATYIDGNAQDIVLGSDVFSAGTIANLQGDY
jgi:hypothetical protein